MDIVFNKWYVIDDKESREAFLKYFASLPNRLNEITEEHRKAECLNIKIDNGYRLCYRTKYNPRIFYE